MRKLNLLLIVLLLAAGKAGAQTSKAQIIQNLLNNMVRVEGGTYMMGRNMGTDKEVKEDETPAHEVTLSDYYIGKYEVTQEEWEAVMGTNPAKFKDPKRPVEQVGWQDCVDFAEKLSRLTGKKFRLPTEAEWEYAARGGKLSKDYKYAGSNDADEVAWYVSNCGGETHPVGQKKPNELGLYDMSGNVWEWVSDWHGYYRPQPQTNPTGPHISSEKVKRGGATGDDALQCRTTQRHFSLAWYRIPDLGCRVVYVP